MNKLEEKKIQDAWVVLEKYNDERNKYYKFNRKEGIKYIKCQHLKEGTHKTETGNMWLGDNLRVICCSICLNVHLGAFVSLLKLEPFENNPKDEEKVEVKENWKDWFIGLFYKT